MYFSKFPINYVSHLLNLCIPFSVRIAKIGFYNCIYNPNYYRAGWTMSAAWAASAAGPETASETPYMGVWGTTEYL